MIVADNLVRPRPEAQPVFLALARRQPRFPAAKFTQEQLLRASGLDQQEHSAPTKHAEPVDQLSKVGVYRTNGMGSRHDHVIVIAQAARPIGVLAVGHEIPRQDAALALIHFPANRDAEQIAIDAIDF